MKLKKLLLMGAMLAVVGVLAAEDWKLPGGEQPFRRGPGAELAAANCTICHSADYVSMQPPLNLAGWTALVQKMREKYGAPLPENQVEPIVNYLVSQYGKK